MFRLGPEQDPRRNNSDVVNAKMREWTSSLSRDFTCGISSYSGKTGWDSDLTRASAVSTA
jgi:hypothetical protein